jgi:hypothetical protein
MIVSSALSLMLTLGSVLVPPDGCSVVAIEDDGRAFATCTDPHTWFEFDPTGTHTGRWSLIPSEPPDLPPFRAQSDARETNSEGAPPLVRGAEARS